MKNNTNFVRPSAMEQVSDVRKILRGAAFGRVVLLAVIFSLMSSAVMAKPVTYTGFTITDGKLGSWSFHNARVYLTFQGDTNNVRLITPPNPLLGGTVDILVNETGKASVTIISGEKVVSAKFVDGQILVSLDLGDTAGGPNGNPPHVGARGVGFSSFTAAGFEPAYPLGLEDGTVDWGDITPGVPSQEVMNLPLTLLGNTRFSGRAWSCVGFPNDCAPPNPLKTDKGPLLLYTPYSQAPGSNNFCNSLTGGASLFSSCDSLSAGFFVADVGETDKEDRFSPQITTSKAKSKNPITYYGYVIADVTLGGDHYPGAQVYLSFDADTSTAVKTGPLCNNELSQGFVNATGESHVTVISGSHIISADFEPEEQMYVYYDLCNASVGFGSTAGGNGYPLSITANQDINGLVEDSSVGAVSDLTLHGDASSYTPATATLKTDLTNATTLSGGASTCQGFNPATSNCNSLMPLRLNTNRGGFYMTEPYRQDQGTGGQYSITWGIFWSEIGHKGKGDE